MIFRPCEREDVEALYAISLATGYLGRDASHLYEDARMMGHIYAAPYAVLESALSLVVEEGEKLLGFAVGALDTGEWEMRLERDWWPTLRRLYPDPSHTPPEQRSPDQKRAHMIHHPTSAPSSVREGFPAHVHLNLMPVMQGRGIGSRLFAAWLAAARDRGATTIHVAVNRANEPAIRFWQKQSFAPIRPDPSPGGRTLWMGRAD